jgi:Secretion system C-terminal sorting domain
VYPNPTNGNITLTSSENTNQVFEIINARGQVVYTGTLHIKQEVNMSNWSVSYKDK